MMTFRGNPLTPGEAVVRITPQASAKSQKEQG